MLAVRVVFDNNKTNMEFGAQDAYYDNEKKMFIVKAYEGNAAITSHIPREHVFFFSVREFRNES